MLRQPTRTGRTWSCWATGWWNARRWCDLFWLWRFENFNSVARNGLGWVLLEVWRSEAENILHTVEKILMFLAWTLNQTAPRRGSLWKAAFSVCHCVKFHSGKLKSFRSSEKVCMFCCIRKFGLVDSSWFLSPWKTLGTQRMPAYGFLFDELAACCRVILPLWPWKISTNLNQCSTCLNPNGRITCLFVHLINRYEQLA